MNYGYTANEFSVGCRFARMGPFPDRMGSYEPEIADTVVALRDIDSPQELAEKIKSIYEFAFDETVKMEKCLEVAQKLLIIKNDASCSI